jgi:hypothetical protein
LESSSQQGDKRARRWLKYLRMGFSGACGVLCLLLSVLWVISLGRYSGIEGHVGKQSFSLISSLGQLDIYSFTTKAVPFPLPWRITDSTVSIDEVKMPEHLGFEIYPSKAGLSVFISYWLLVLLAAVGAVGPWVPWHFSLRTLLIATTLIAILLGLIAYAAS